MLEPSTHQHNEQIADLQAQLDALKQENIGLKLRLQFCEPQTKLQQDVGSLHHLLEVTATSAVAPASATAANAVLKILLEAEQARSAELEKVNEALRRGVERLAETGDINALLDSFLLEAIAVTGASAGAVFDRVTGTEFQVRSLAQDGAIFRSSDTDAFGGALREVSARDPVGAFKQITEGQVYCHEVDSHYASWFPEAAAYHRQQGNQVTWNFPFRIGHEVAGFLGIAFREHRSPNLIMTETVQALSHQVSLALETLRLAEEAKQAALAREQERAAQERAAELTKMNQALQAEVVEREWAERLARGQTETLVNTLTVLAADPVLDNFLGYMLQAIANQLGDSSGGIWLYDETQNTTVLHLNYEDGQIQQGSQIVRPGTDRQVLQQWDIDYMQTLREQKLLIQDLQQFANLPAYAPYHAHNQQRGIKTILIVALFFGDTFLGNITLRRTEYRDYKPEELALARVLAHQAALAIQLTRFAEQGRQAAIIEERNRMAREIHDTIAQGLSGIVIQLQAAAAIADRNAQQEHLTQARQLAEFSLTEARRSVQALRPHQLEATNLADALTTLTQHRTQNTDAHFICEVCGSPYPLLPDVESHLFRIAQEALTNAVKHAHASEVHLTLVYQPTQVQLIVHDNGHGFDPNCQSTQGFGMIGMQERSQRIGAVFTLTSQPGQGTTVQVILPVLIPLQEIQP